MSDQPRTLSVRLSFDSESVNKRGMSVTLERESVASAPHTPPLSFLVTQPQHRGHWTSSERDPTSLRTSEEVSQASTTIINPLSYPSCLPHRQRQQHTQHSI